MSIQAVIAKLIMFSRNVYNIIQNKEAKIEVVQKALRETHSLIA